ncbi:MAG: hypothetical protein AAF996_14760 [Pseudomonadota bacterium]
MKIKLTLLLGIAALTVGAAAADRKVDKHAEICTAESGDSEQCYCKAKTIKSLSSNTSDEYDRAVKAVETVGDALVTELFLRGLNTEEKRTAYSNKMTQCLEQIRSP